MKSDSPAARSVSLSFQSDGDSSKLLSLLALATAALAMPQTSDADIIYTDLSANPPVVGPHGTNSFLIDNLPGISGGRAQILFQTHAGAPHLPSSRWVSAQRMGYGYIRFKTHSAFIVPLGGGLTWDMVPLPAVSSVNGEVGRANPNLLAHLPDSFDHMYAVFKFKDNSLPGSPLRYGWIDLSLSNPANGTGPDVTIYRYAFESTGVKIPTGFVPEPSSMTLLALGALTLGAKGLRSWRQKRASSEQSVS